MTFYRPTEGWFNQTLRGEIVMGVVDPGEPAGVDQRSSWAFLRRTAELMTRKAPALRDVTVIRQWAGMYDVSPDHLPLVGPTRQLDGWWQANGWSGRGMLLAPYLMTQLADAHCGRHHVTRIWRCSTRTGSSRAASPTPRPTTTAATRRPPGADRRPPVARSAVGLQLGLQRGRRLGRTARTRRRLGDDDADQDAAGADELERGQDLAEDERRRRRR